MKSTLRALLIFIFLLGLIYHPGCSTTDEVDNQFDVTGEWSGYLDGGLTREFWVTFFENNYCIGMLENYAGEFDQSNYQISNGNISIDLDSGLRDFLMEGTIENDDRMSGTWSSIFYEASGTWWLERD